MNTTRKLSGILSGCIAAFCVAVLCGCTSVAEIRTIHEPRLIEQASMDPYKPNVGCESSSSTASDRLNSIEDYVDGDAASPGGKRSSFWAGYVEFDDEGWMYDKDQSRENKLNQLDAVMSRLRRELNDPAFAEDDFLVVAFVHGWHHNANDTDCNVHEFRSMLKIANDRYAAAGGGRRQRIVGIYVGWRGESIDVDYLNVTTVLDRRNAAERVAKGDVRELFAQLRAMQIGATAASIESGDGVQPRANRMRTVVIGHSFGGLIAFHGLSPAVLNELTLTKPRLPEPTAEDRTPGCAPIARRQEPGASAAGGAAIAAAQASSATTAAGTEQSSGATAASTPNPKEARTAAIAANRTPVFPDLLVLVNPAFEATRFETLHALMRPAGCHYVDPQRPKVVVVTADNDWATGWVFHAGREVLTLLEAYPAQAGSDPKRTRERDSNTHAIGFVERYRTHRLCVEDRPDDKQGSDGSPRALASFMPRPNAEWTFDRYAPVWVVRAPPNIVNGHNGFLFAAQSADHKPVSMEAASGDAQATLRPYLLDWLVNLDLDWKNANSDVMTKDNGCPENTDGY